MIMSDFRICAETGVKITRDMVIGCISDTFKSANGFRPRHIDFSEYSFDELGDYLTEVQEDAEREWKREVIWEREQRKERSRSEKRYQKIRKAAKSGSNHF